MRGKVWQVKVSQRTLSKSELPKGNSGLPAAAAEAKEAPGGATPSFTREGGRETEEYFLWRSSHLG